MTAPSHSAIGHARRRASLAALLCYSSFFNFVIVVVATAVLPPVVLRFPRPCSIPPLLLLLDCAPAAETPRSWFCSCPFYHVSSSLSFYTSSIIFLPLCFLHIFYYLPSTYLSVVFVLRFPLPLSSSFSAFPSTTRLVSTSRAPYSSLSSLGTLVPSLCHLEPHLSSLFPDDLSPNLDPTLPSYPTRSAAE